MVCVSLRELACRLGRVQTSTAQTTAKQWSMLMLAAWQYGAGAYLVYGLTSLRLLEWCRAATNCLCDGRSNVSQTMGCRNCT